METPVDIARLVLEVLLVFSVAVVSNVLGSTIILKYPKYSTENQPIPLRLTGQFLQGLTMVSLVFYIASNQPQGLPAVGLPSIWKPDLADMVHYIESKSYNWLFLLLGGMVVYAGFLLLQALGYKLLGKKKEPADNPAIRSLADYRTPWQRLTFLFVLFLGILGEELVYRGYLVLYLGEKTGAVAVWAVVSILLSVIIHLYQGYSRVIHQFLFATLAVLMTIWSGNLMMALGMHLYLNTIVTLRVWSGKTKAAPARQEGSAE